MAEPEEKLAAGPNGDIPCPPNFEQALVQLETIVHQLEEGEIGLADALAHYETGIGLLKRCYGLLERAERRIELLSGVDAAGNPITQPLSDEASSLEEKSQNRARRRSKATARPAKEGPALGDPSVTSGDEIAESAQIRMDEPGSLF
ncbi:MAG TPA: exodeoxyribonuclease VII small subunit [Pirellulales bacterium]|nr:exodeoxyribonuclease VII small subunit [Pirellulales bacterium]